ncbi:DUF262 domain-containing protein [Lactobacillus sp. LC28-10]|uniref:DUF262 domain-containing protein n=1 Tax=Secundilactobacillus angelensis TaxID=2722706 RepID=A0ABX1KU32_9LACO|nr:DUF262 domain-containing protein [Secundilactobacillus angelensis]MCH5461953.1 DUF262 domain-containing HNH endonuclease family protein [Secundilactobacillus angelensis]NLR17441.1 DUF262 domain-containing protein [Secundilactobacillus angelensis]
MDGNIQYTAQYLQGGTKFIIPVYQRNYDWTIDNCRRLWNDFVKIKSENRPTHFFGSIVVKPADLAQETIIIDGQQRITTVSLLILAIANWMSANNKTDERFKPDKIKEQFLIAPFSSDKNPQKLVPIKRDAQAYYALFSSPKNYVQGSNITNNYQFFYDELDHLKIPIDDLMRSISGLQIMVVNLNSPDDDAQLIFESLNSTGLGLTDADKIRNFLLMRHSVPDQGKIFQDYWEPIEKFTDLRVTSFFRDYLTIKNSKTPINKAIYETFKEYFNIKVADKWAFFEDLLLFAQGFYQISNAATDLPMANRILKRLNYLDVTVQRSFLIAMLVAHAQEKISDSDFIDTLKITENFLARRMIAEVPSNGLNKIFATLYSETMRYHENQDIGLKEILIYLLNARSGSGRYPHNEEIINSLKSRDMYNINHYFRTYFFERLENGDTHEPLNVYKGIEERQYSVEHIMPQKLNQSWKKDLGEQADDVHTKWLHNLGNLTLTGYNSEYSNRQFSEKKLMPGGFNQSHFVNLNYLPARSEKWTENEIQQRLSQLIKLSLERWPEMHSEFVPTSADKEMQPFDGINHFVGYKLMGYSFLDDDYVAERRWKNFYLQIVRKLYDINSTILIDLVNQSGTAGLAAQFSDIDGDNYDQVAPGIYLNTHVGNWDKMQEIKNLFDKYEIHYDELLLQAKQIKLDEK